MFRQITVAGAGLFAAAVLSAQTPKQLHSWLVSVPGWEVLQETEIFNPDNLFDRINGAAPLFLENSFREMTSLEYRNGDQYITIQAYRHATPEDAFGMYASERSDELEHVAIGGEAQGDARHLYFFAGSIYVKMWSSGTEDVRETLHTIGRGLAARIDPEAAYPVILRYFPEKDKTPCSEAYITGGYIGHEFLRSVYTAKYETDGKAYQLFVIDAGTKEAAQGVLTDYFAFTKQSHPFTEGALQIKDRYNGNLPVIWKGRHIVGACNENGETVTDAEPLLKALAEKLP
jgi:hypothetical protein